MKITAEISNQVIKLLSNQVQSQREVTELLNAVKTRLKLLCSVTSSLKPLTTYVVLIAIQFQMPPTNETLST